MFGIMVIDYVFVFKNNQSRFDTTIIIIIIYHQHPCIREIFTRHTFIPISVFTQTTTKGRKNHVKSPSMGTCMRTFPA